MKDHRIILIATPEPSTKQQILDWLSAQGYRAAAVERGSDALLAVAEDNIRLVIVDLSLQEPSGQRPLKSFERFGLGCR
jgi:DNA-binding response OmpR family regulator